MWRWRRVGVVRVFALVMRCRIMRLLLCSRVGKNRDTRRETPAGAGAGRTADHLTFLFSQKVLAVRKANDIYRPVSTWNYILTFQVYNAILDSLILLENYEHLLQIFDKRVNAKGFQLLTLELLGNKDLI